MKILKMITALALFTSVAFAGPVESYVTLKFGAYNIDQTVIGESDGYDENNLYIWHDSFNPAGLEYYVVKKFDFYVLTGVGADILTDGGKLFEGGVIGADYKLGIYYDNLSLYGFIGYGVNSLSRNTLAHGYYYGGAISYDIQSSYSLKVEFRQHHFKTPSTNNATSEQSYVVSGPLFSIGYKF